MDREPSSRVIVECSLDVSTGRLPEEGITLEEYRRYGGVPVGPQVEVVHGVVLGSIEDRPAIYSTRTAFAGNPERTSRSDHTVLHGTL